MGNSIIREKGWSVIKISAHNSRDIHFDSQEAEVLLTQCVEPMLDETRQKIEERVPVFDSSQKHWGFQNFSACNVDTCEAFSEALDIALCVERDENVDGNLFLIVSVVSAERPMHEYSASIKFGSRDTVLEYLGTKEAQTNLLRTMKRLINEAMN